MKQDLLTKGETLHHCQRSKKGFTWHVISIIAKNRPHAHHKTYLHTMKVYNTKPVSLLLIKFSFFSTTDVFTCSKVINAFNRQNSWTDTFFAKHAWLRSCNDSYSQFPRSPLGTPGTTMVVLCTKYEEKNPLADYESCCLG